MCLLTPILTILQHILYLYQDFNFEQNVTWNEESINLCRLFPTTGGLFTAEELITAQHMLYVCYAIFLVKLKNSEALLDDFMISAVLPLLFIHVKS